MTTQGTTDPAIGGDTELELADWKRAHTELVRLAALRASLDWDEGRSLLSALRFGAHLKLGFGAFFEYVERLFAYRPRFTQEKLRVAEALEELPELDRALRDGELSWSAVRELTRVATLTTEHSWIDAARGRTMRDVEKLVSGRKPGDRPNDPASPAAKRHTLRFEVTAEVLATFRDAMAKLRREAGTKLDDDEALLLMARQVLGGPRDSGRSSYHLSVTVCERCRQAYQRSAGEQVGVDPAVVAMAECDAQQLGHTHADARKTPEPTRATQTISPAVRRQVLERDGRKCALRQRGFSRNLRTATEGLSRPEGPRFSRKRRTPRPRLRHLRGRRQRTLDRGDPATKNAGAADEPRHHLNPFRCTTYHCPRHEIRLVSSSSLVFPSGSLKRSCDRSTRK
jgi:hypothetical protein